ncbi:MAG TPA: 6,7-dimethyl-8-ribityllumazine synthase [Acidimicrobiales bacterium]|nr:6,7-dimethyl-8-ribityllumazine synthase [Acidimicrobiales bacterium]
MRCPKRAMSPADGRGAGPEGSLLDGTGLRIGVATGRFNGNITELLADGCRERLAKLGVAGNDVVEVGVPGAFELPLAAQALIRDADVDAVVCLGAVIRGETSHYDFVAGECAAGLQRVQLDTGRPVVFGVLTTENVEQALSRAGGGHGHKGEEAAETAVEMVRLLQSIRR